MYIEAQKWRKREGIDTILETFPKNRFCKLLLNYWPNLTSPMAHTKDGQTVIEKHFLSI